MPTHSAYQSGHSCWKDWNEERKRKSVSVSVSAEGIEGEKEGNQDLQKGRSTGVVGGREHLSRPS